MGENEYSPRDDCLLEEYKQRHDYIRFLGTEQSLVAIALLSFNGLAMFQSKGNPTCVLSILMILVGIFGIAHNNRLIQRYEENASRLREVATDLKLRSVIAESGRPFYAKMRFWFYILYLSITGFWCYRLLDPF